MGHVLLYLVTLHLSDEAFERGDLLDQLSVVACFDSLFHRAIFIVVLVLRMARE